MTNEQISKLVASAKRGFSDWQDVEDTPSSAVDMIADLCTAIEVLTKRLDRCKRQRDYYNRYSNDEFLKSLEECDQELDEIGSGE